MEVPPRERWVQRGTHRLIPSQHARSALARLADDAEHLEALFALDNATNDRLMTENDRAAGIGRHELVFGIPHYRIINAAFTHAHPLGSRFNGPDRGAWYASGALRTSQHEVAFHRALHYAEIGRFDDSITYDDYRADFATELHVLRDTPKWQRHLHPSDYTVSQDLAQRLLHEGAAGVVYPSVRHPGGTCVACFRPALVTHVTRGHTYRFTWHGTPVPRVTRDAASA